MNDNNFAVHLNFADDSVFENVKAIKISPDPIHEPHLIHRPPVVVFGKPCRQNRNVGFFSDHSVGYRYSGQLMASQPLTGWMKELMDAVNSHLGTDFNGILINHYQSGEDYIGAHRDDEGGLDPAKKAVAAISFGAVRKFRIRDNDRKIVADVPTEHGSMIVMMGDFQQKFTHEIPVEKKISGGRWSITFRHHKM
jgi:alkylated DNA repair dioxygenase AlkB